MAGKISRLEIFGAGTWNSANAGKVTVTESEIQDIVDNFAALKNTNIVKPHLKLGHTEAQKWFGQKNGIPTLGWIDNVWREGKKLLADISNVPDAILNLIRQGRYHNVSAEIYPPGVVEHGDKKLGHVLSAVAILGTEMPAVKDLDGLANALFANTFTAEIETKPINYSQDVKNMFTQEQVDALTSAAVDKAVKEAQSKFAADLSNSAAQVEVLTKRAESAEAKITALEAEFAAKEIDGLIETAIKEGRMLPAQKDVAKAFMSSMGDKVVSFGGKEKTPVQLFSDFLGLMGKQVKFQEAGSGKTGAGSDTFSTPAQELDVKINEMLKSNPAMKYEQAYTAVLAADPELKTRYAEGAV